MKNIMFIAAPAAGKGTQAELLVNKYHISHISTGDILRNIAKEDSEIGNYVYEMMSNGELVKDEIIYKIVEDYLIKTDCQNGFIIDGFPRNYQQALQFDEILNRLGLNLNYVFVLDISKKTLEKRVTGRRICEDCKAVYNINEESKMPLKESICDRCGGKLLQRKDDNLEAFQIRYNNYLEKTASILDYYENKGVLYHVDGNRDVMDIFEEIDNILNEKGN